MKKTILILAVTPTRLRLIFMLAVTLIVVEASFSQVKVIKATSQKVIAGMGGVFMNYEVGLQNKNADSLVIDSVKTIAGKASVNFYFNKTEPAYTEIAFGYSLVEAPKCRTCPDSGVQQVNFTKGVLIYYKRGGKKSTSKVKKFKRLEDKLLP